MSLNYFNSLHRSRHTTQDGSLSDEYSDFPPIREPQSTPDSPTASVTGHFHHRSSATQFFKPRSSEVQSPPRPKKGLGRKNTLNTIKLSKPPNSSSKRGLEVGVANERPWKRQHQMLEGDVDYLKGEFYDIRTRITEIGEHLKGLLAALPPPSVADSYTGLVSFTGLALLGCPEPVLKSRAVDLVAQIYIGSPTIDFLSSLCGSLRYFNSDRIIFSYGPSELYLIQGTIAQVPSNGSNLPFLPPDSDFIGDIHSIVHLGPAPQDGIEPQIDINRRITLHVSGLVLNSNADEGTFTVNVKVNISSYKNAKDVDGVNVLQPPAPFLCIIPKSPNNGIHWDKLEMPSNRSIVSVVGMLTDVTFIHGDRHQGIEFFHLTAQDIVSLSTHTPMEQQLRLCLNPSG